MTADLDRLDALAAAADGHWPTLVFQDGDGDLVRCSCGEQGFDFKQGREWFASHIVGLMHATIRELVAKARERDKLRAALERTHDALYRMDAQAADGGGARGMVYVTVKAWRRVVQPVIEQARAALHPAEIVTGRYSDRLRAGGWSPAPDPVAGLRERIDNLGEAMQSLTEFRHRHVISKIGAQRIVAVEDAYASLVAALLDSEDPSRG